jgi:hypothetical protein
VESPRPAVRKVDQLGESGVVVGDSSCAASGRELDRRYGMLRHEDQKRQIDHPVVPEIATHEGGSPQELAERFLRSPRPGAPSSAAKLAGSLGQVLREVLLGERRVDSGEREGIETKCPGAVKEAGSSPPGGFARAARPRLGFPPSAAT